MREKRALLGLFRTIMDIEVSEIYITFGSSDSKYAGNIYFINEGTFPLPLTGDITAHEPILEGTQSDA